MQRLNGYGRVRLREARTATVKVLCDPAMDVERNTDVKRFVLRSIARGAAAQAALEYIYHSSPPAM